MEKEPNSRLQGEKIKDTVGLNVFQANQAIIFISFTQRKDKLKEIESFSVNPAKNRRLKTIL